MSATETLRLDGDLTIQTAAERLPPLHAAAQAAALAGGTLVLQLADVQALDSAGVQLLLSLRKTLADYGVPLAVDGASDVVRAVLDTYGLQALLAPSAMPATEATP